MQFLTENGTVILAVLFGLSETLSLIPSIKSNGIFQLIYNMLKTVHDSAKPNP